MYKDTDLAWAAGFIDGEGCITLVNKQTKNDPDLHLIMLEVTNTDKRGLNKLFDLFGGVVQEKKRGSSFANSKAAICYRWLIYSTPAANICELLIPFLVIKQHQAKIIRLYQTVNDMYAKHEHRSKHMSEEERILRRRLKEKISELNSRGSNISSVEQIS